MAKLFFSYSHQDESMRDELEKHFSVLRYQGAIESWHDRKIGPGKEWVKEIDVNLESSEVILLLISHNFLASKYCFEIEAQRALEKHERGEARVIPVILDSCDWKNTPLGELQAATKDGKAISKYPNPNDGFLEVVEAVRNVIKETGKTVVNKKNEPLPIGPVKQPITPKPRSSNLRIKKDFSDREKDEFLEESYGYIANHFEGSLEELQNRNSPIKTKFKRIDANHLTATIYKNDKIAGECKIWLEERDRFTGSIRYAHSASSGDNSYNESMSIEEDGYMLFLKPMGISFRRQGNNKDELLSQQGAAEYFWEMLIEPLQ